MSYLLIPISNPLGPITMVNVPVHYKHPLDPMGLYGVFSGDGDVVEETEPTGSVIIGVVSGGTDYTYSGTGFSC